MSRDPNDTPVNLNEKPIERLWDCLSLLAPPLRLATIAAVAATDGLEKNIPETTARLTGGRILQAQQHEEFRTRSGHDLQPHPQPLRAELPAAVAAPRLPRPRVASTRLRRS
jgi:hypothetical protein